MSPLETEFHHACTDCIQRGVELNLHPTEVIAELYALLFVYERKAADAGFGKNWASDTHVFMTAILAEMVPPIAIGGNPISEAEMAILESLWNSPAHSLPNIDLVSGIDSCYREDFPESILTLDRRGLVTQTDAGKVWHLTSAGKTCFHAWHGDSIT